MSSKVYTSWVRRVVGYNNRVDMFACVNIFLPRAKLPIVILLYCYYKCKGSFLEKVYEMRIFSVKVTVLLKFAVKPDSKVDRYMITTTKQ